MHILEVKLSTILDCCQNNVVEMSVNITCCNSDQISLQIYMLCIESLYLKNLHGLTWVLVETENTKR